VLSALNNNDMNFPKFEALFNDGQPNTTREEELSDAIDEMFIGDAEQTSKHQSNRRYRIKHGQIIYLFHEYSDIPVSRILAILSYQNFFWTNV